MNDLLLELDTQVYDRLDMSALQRALRIQLALVESLGSLRASLLGMHLYHFALIDNCTAVDRVILLLAQYGCDWPEALKAEVGNCAKLRFEQHNSDDWQQSYRAEAEYILTLASASTHQREQLVERLRQYQIYACPHLLGAQGLPAFFETQQIEALLDPQNSAPAVLYARQFSERLRKPELLARELAQYYAQFD